MNYPQEVFAAQGSAQGAEVVTAETDAGLLLSDQLFTKFCQDRFLQGYGISQVSFQQHGLHKMNSRRPLL